jgi:hypothetical protein
MYIKTYGSEDSMGFSIAHSLRRSFIMVNRNRFSPRLIADIITMIVATLISVKIDSEVNI